MSAPIALFLYNRPEHSKRTIDALLANHAANDADLYVFCDGARNESDREAVNQVQRLTESVSGFRSVTVTRNTSNQGLGTSIINGVTEVLKKHDTVIVLEDDLVTHPDTLDYFNRCLERYRDYAGIFSISGYSYPPGVMEIPAGYEYDVYAIPRMQCWGWATWRDRWARADWSMADFEAFNSSDTLCDAYAHWIGPDSLGTLRAYMEGKKDVWASRWVYTHFKHHALCMCPTVSYVDNIGLDGSGANCGAQNDRANDLTLARPQIADLKLPHMVVVDPVIFENFMKVVDPRRRVKAAEGVAGSVIQTRRGFFSKLLYWGVRPVQLARRILGGVKRRVKNRLQQPGAAPVAAAASSSLVSEPRVPLVRLGTEYGGWSVPVEGIGPDDTVVSAGAGEDISFDIELAKKFKPRIVIVDPTPRARHHYDETTRLIRNGEAAPVNNNPDVLYDAAAGDIEHISFSPVGLWDKDDTVRFFPPANDSHVSHSIDNMHETEGGFDAECVTLDTLMERESINDISVLKMDIEGAEYAVIDYMLGHAIKPRYLMIEFHPGQDEQERVKRTRTNEYVSKLEQFGYKLVENRGWDYVFESR